MNQQQAKNLNSKVLAYGGREMKSPEVENQVVDLIERGYLRTHDKVTLMQGAPHQCHMNSAKLWFSNRDWTVVVTGYARVKDTWFQHTWCESLEGDEIFETTVEFDAYFGMELTLEEADEFYFNNAW
jgi:hypothetical protein